MRSFYRGIDRRLEKLSIIINSLAKTTWDLFVVVLAVRADRHISQTEIDWKTDTDGDRQRQRESGDPQKDNRKRKRERGRERERESE